jgi:2-oxoglutarate dehydrogenase E2 component (dihydrolipoamide succinyltransferase)
MTVAITVPSVGESVMEGTIARWLKKDGEPVRAQEPLFELETDKATTSVPAPASGTLHIETPEGQTVAIGAVIGQIELGARATGGDGRRRESATPSAPAPQPPAPAPQGPSAAVAEVPLSPAVRRLARENDIDVRQVRGTGRGGRITKEDLLRHLEQRKTKLAAERPETAPQAPAMAAPPPSPGPGAVPAVTSPRETRQRMSAIRQRIAERLVASQRSTATLTTFNEADLSAVMALRSRYRDRFREKYDTNLGFMSFFVKASVAALQEFPVANSRIEGNEIVTPHEYHIGIAVSTEKGLMVPVLRNADQLRFADIERRIAELADKTRQGTITVDDLQGGTFTITNGGVFGSLLSTPILNPPQSAILGMHTIQKRPTVVEDQVAIRPMMYLALSYDHRLIDGREAVLFLSRVKECIENPERMLLEI